MSNTTTVALVGCQDYEPGRLEPALARLLEAMGGLERFVKRGSRVLLKPNLLSAHQPSCHITTHPQIVRFLIRRLRTLGCDVFLGDSPSAWGENDVYKVYETTGMRAAAEEEGARIIIFNKSRWHNDIPLCTCLEEYDHLINLPKFKTHNLTILTGAIKNLFGLVSGLYKVELHKRALHAPEFSRILVDIYREARPSLHIVDGVMALEGNGPATQGKIRHMGVLVAGADAVAVDSILACLMGLKPDVIPTTRIAAEQGLGIAEVSRIHLAGEPWEKFQAKDFRLPRASLMEHMPGWLLACVRRIRPLIRLQPVILAELCEDCGLCQKACPQGCIRKEQARRVIDYKSCALCLCCQEVCPQGAIKTQKSFLARMMGL